MVWEVDEDCDGCVSWAEFQAMFERCRADKAGERLPCPCPRAGLLASPAASTPCCALEASPRLLACRAGTEPRQLFNVVQFVIHDREGVGSVSLEEAMNLTYMQHGRVGAAGGAEAWLGWPPLPRLLLPGGGAICPLTAAVFT